MHLLRFGTFFASHTEDLQLSINYLSADRGMPGGSPTSPPRLSAPHSASKMPSLGR